MVECGCYISHEAHQEKWHLKDIFRDEVHPTHKFIIPGHGIEIEEEGEEP